MLLILLVDIAVRAHGGDLFNLAGLRGEDGGKDGAEEGSVSRGASDEGRAERREAKNEPQQP